MLHLILPCPADEQTSVYTDEQKTIYFRVLSEADSVEICSPHKSGDCMKKRNLRLVGLADVIICFFNEKDKRSGTAQTVRMAENKGIEVINLCR